MKKVFLTMLVFVFGLCAWGSANAEGLINGAGSTFAYPLYAKWAYEYNKKTGIKLNYQSIGSGGGIKQIKSKTVDFGATDAPLAAKELEAAKLTQFPMAIGGVVPVINLPGVKPGEVKLTGEALSEIYLGKILRWNDKRLVDLNPGVNMPDEKITVVYRSDGSGTTWIFTNYLDKISKAWHEKAGTGTAVNWPVGVGGKGNEGVATYVKRLKGSIGYVEYAYALQNKLLHTRLSNRDKAFVEPSMESFAAAAQNADWKGTPGFGVILTDQPGKAAWPIAGATFILIYKNPSDCRTAKTMLEFFDWSYLNGADMARSMDYVPVPKQVYELMRKAWAKDVRCDGKAVFGE